MRGILKALCASIIMIWSLPAFAQAGYTPAATSFVGTGGLVMSRAIGSDHEYWTCSISLSGRTDTSVGGNPTRANKIIIDSFTVSDSIYTGCNSVKLNPTTITIKDPNCYGGEICGPNPNGVMNGWRAYVPNNYGSQTLFCDQVTVSVPVTFQNSTTSSTMSIQTPPQGGSQCYITITVTLTPNIQYLAN